MEGKKHQELNQILEIVEGLAAQAVEQTGLELVDVEWKTSEGKPLIVVYIDNANGVSLEHCQKVSKVLGELLDREDPFPSSYFLEVSSPGVERRLKKASDFIRFAGSNVKVKTYQKINNSRNFRGVIKSFAANNLTLVTENGEEVKIDLENISKANLWYKHEPRR